LVLLSKWLTRGLCTKSEWRCFRGCCGGEGRCFRGWCGGPDSRPARTLEHGRERVRRDRTRGQTLPAIFDPMPERDLFANFERMRREMDQLFGDWPGRGLVGARSSGFSPKIDLYYCGDPQRAIVKVDLAGVELGEVTIEVSGRELAISGERALQETEGRVYQQVEIDSGPFRRIVELQADVDPERAKATYEDGVLRIELPLREQTETARRVPIDRE